MKFKWNTLLVPGVLFIGVLGIWITQKPHTICDSQVDIFRESQRGLLYSKEEKGKRQVAQYKRFFMACREGGTPGSCLEYFSLIRRVLRDLDSTQLNCSEEFREIPEIRLVLSNAIEIFVTLAWGKSPPSMGDRQYQWLNSSDIALFCSVKKNFVKIYGESNFETSATQVISVLPGEPVKLSSDGKCLNCDGEGKRKMAPLVLGQDEIWAKSLFSVRCESYL
jgi:hypothetical protein